MIHAAMLGLWLRGYRVIWQIVSLLQSVTLHELLHLGVVIGGLSPLSLPRESNDNHKFFIKLECLFFTACFWHALISMLMFVQSQARHKN